MDGDPDGDVVNFHQVGVATTTIQPQCGLSGQTPLQHLLRSECQMYGSIYQKVSNILAQFLIVCLLVYFLFIFFLA
jgi:hypothetical protein